jgi:hypothetical protein
MQDKVFGPETSYWCYGSCVPEQDPQLHNCKASNPSNSEKSNPFYADRSPKPKASSHQPEPPAWIEGFCGSLFVLVRKAGPSKSGESCENYQRRIKEDQA